MSVTTGPEAGGGLEKGRLSQERDRKERKKRKEKNRENLLKSPKGPRSGSRRPEGGEVRKRPRDPQEDVGDLERDLRGRMVEISLKEGRRLQERSFARLQLLKERLRVQVYHVNNDVKNLRSFILDAEDQELYLYTFDLKEGKFCPQSEEGKSDECIRYDF